MKLNHLISGLTLATAAAVVAVPSHAAVSYEGSPDAVAVCRAIIDDDSSDLKQAIRRAVPRHEKTTSVERLQKTFHCNGQALSEFAVEVGSYEALGVLTGEPEGHVAVR